MLSNFLFLLLLFVCGCAQNPTNEQGLAGDCASEPHPRSSFQFKPGSTMMDYLNPKLFENPETMEEIGNRLKRGDLVVIRDAFQTDFAEYVWNDLSREDIPWKLQEDYADYGFTYHHHNVYDWEDYTPVMRETYSIFDHVETKKWMTELSGRDCMGENNPSGSASRYFPGDYSLPHTDHDTDRTVAFVWHLSKDWIAEWGGALYWIPENHEYAYVQASFNTLNLFSVTWNSAHFVTTVSNIAEGKRLTYNGWWDSSLQSSLDHPLEEMFSTPEARAKLTKTQMDWILDADFSYVPSPRREKLQELATELFAERYPEPSLVHYVYPEGPPEPYEVAFEEPFEEELEAGEEAA